MQNDFNLKVPVKINNGKTRKTRKGIARKSMAIALSVILSASMCIPGMAAEMEIEPVAEPVQIEEAAESSENIETEQEEQTTDSEGSEDIVSTESPVEDVAQDEDVSENDSVSDASLENEEAPAVSETENTVGEEAATENDADSALAEEIEKAPLLTEEEASETSEWLSEYSYSTDDASGIIYLNGYNGEATDITVPGSAVINGIEYNSVSISSGLWPNAVSLSFESGVKLPDSCYRFFASMSSLTSIDLSAIDKSNVTVMWSMFEDCSSLISVDLSNFNTSNVTDMDRMFAGCHSLREVNLSSFDLTNLIYHSNVFEECSRLEVIQTPTGLDLDILLPNPFSGSDGEIYTTLPKYSTASITLTKAEISDWLSDYDYYYSDNNVVITGYHGSEEYLTIPGYASVNNEDCGVIVDSFRDNTIVKSLSFENGVVIYPDWSQFSGLSNLETIDLSNITMQYFYQMGGMFSGCSNLETIIVPANLTIDGVLPAAFVDSEGNLYSKMPSNLSEGITITRAEASDWLNDYSYKIEGNKIILISYSGNDSEVIVPGSGIVNGQQYNTVEINNNIWENRRSNITTLSFGEGVVFPSYCDSMFGYMYNLTSLDLSNVDTSNVSYIGSLFYDCNSLTSLDLSNFDLSGVEYASDVFNGCSSLEMIIAPKGITANITLPYTYADNNGNYYTTLPKNLNDSIQLTKQEASDWLNSYEYTIEGDTIVLNRLKSWITQISIPGSAEIGTREFTKIELRPGMWSYYNGDITDISLAEGVVLPADSSQLFAYMHQLTLLDLSLVDCSKVTVSDGMFDNTHNLSTIIAPADLSADIELPYPFVDSEGNVYFSLPIGTAESITLTKVEDVSEWLRDYAFTVVDGTIILKEFVGEGYNLSLTVYSSGDIAGVTYDDVRLSSGMWENRGYQIDKLVFEEGVLLPEDCSRLFADLSHMTSLDVSMLDTSNVTDMSEMFYYCWNLHVLDLSTFDFSNVTDLSGMFSQCGSLSTVSFGNADTSNVTDMSSMFYSCYNLNTLDLSEFDTSLVTDMGGMFCDCNRLTGLDLSGFDTSSVTNMANMFEYCNDLTSLNLTGFNTSNVEDMTSMFNYCYNLTGLDLSSFETPNVRYMDAMFRRCRNLLSLNLSNADFSNLESCARIIDGCNSLLVINAPKGVKTSIGLPGAYTGTDGYVYTALPKQLKNSIVLTWVSESGDVSGDVSGDPASGDPEKSSVRITEHPEDVSTKVGQTASFHVEAEDSEGGDLTYQWYWSTDGTTWRNCTSGGYNTDTFSFKMKASFAGRQYRCMVSNGTSSAFSRSAELTIGNYAEIITQPKDLYVKAGDRASFSIEVDGDNLTYQWQYSKNGTTWTNCTSGGYNTDTFSFTMKAGLAGRQYRCVVTSGEDTIVSDAATVFQKTGTEITEQPVDTAAKVGETVTLHVGADGDDLTYQWQYSKNGTTWTNCTSGSYNTDTFSFTMKAGLAGRLYRCVVAGAEDSVASEAARISIKTGMEITEQPVDTEAEIGERVTLHVAAEGENLTYQWQWSKNGTTWNNCTSGGYNTDTFSFKMNNTINGRQYRCSISDGTETVNSNGAHITLRTGSAITITAQPEDVSAQAGEQVSFHVEAEGENLTYQWQWSKNGTTWTNCTSGGYNTDTFGFKMKTTYAGRQYRCVLSDGAGHTAATDSAVISIAAD